MSTPRAPLLPCSFTLPLCYGTGLLLPVGLLPYPVPLDVVVGSPLEVPKFEGRCSPALRQPSPQAVQLSRQRGWVGARNGVMHQGAAQPTVALRHPGADMPGSARQHAPCPLPRPASRLPCTPAAGDETSAEFAALVDKYHGQYVAALQVRALPPGCAVLCCTWRRCAVPALCCGSD